MVAANQFAACDEGIEPLSVFPMPAGTCTFSKVQNGRGRPSDSFSIWQIQPSPRQSTTKKKNTNNRPRVCPFQISQTANNATVAKKNEFPLRNGITTSNTGFRNVSLMNRNIVTSSDC